MSLVYLRDYKYPRYRIRYILEASNSSSKMPTSPQFLSWNKHPIFERRYPGGKYPCIYVLRNRDIPKRNIPLNMWTSQLLWFQLWRFAPKFQNNCMPKTSFVFISLGPCSNRRGSDQGAWWRTWQILRKGHDAVIRGECKECNLGLMSISLIFPILFLIMRWEL